MLNNDIAVNSSPPSDNTLAIQQLWDIRNRLEKEALYLNSYINMPVRNYLTGIAPISYDRGSGKIGINLDNGNFRIRDGVLDTRQDIAPSSSPAFASMTIIKDDSYLYFGQNRTMGIKKDATTGNLYFNSRITGTENFQFAGGMVGVGVDPTELHHIKDATTGAIACYKAEANACSAQLFAAGTTYGVNYGGQSVADYAVFWGADVSGMMIGTGTATSILFATNNTKVLTMASGGNIYTEDTFDYAGTSTISGWEVGYTAQIWHKITGKNVDVEFRITGESNANPTRFTVKYASRNNTNQAVRFPCLAVNSGLAVAAAAYGQLNANTSTVDLYLDWSTTAYATTGTKTITGSFSYERA